MTFSHAIPTIHDCIGLRARNQAVHLLKAHRRFKRRVWLLLWRRRCRSRCGLLRLLSLLVLLVLRSIRLVLLPVGHLLVGRQRSVLLSCHLLRHVELHVLLLLLLWGRRQLLRLLPLLCGCKLLLLLLLHWWRSLLVRRLLLVWRRRRRQPRLLCLLRLALEWWLLLWGRRRPLVGLLPCHANLVASQHVMTKESRNLSNGWTAAAPAADRTAAAGMAAARTAAAEAPDSRLGPHGAAAPAVAVAQGHPCQPDDSPAGHLHHTAAVAQAQLRQRSSCTCHRLGS